jgi:hypothetical protein
MKMSAFEDKQKLDMIGNRKRAELVANTDKEAKRQATATAIKHSYSALIENVLGASAYAFITINLDIASMGRALDLHLRGRCKESANNLVLGRAYHDARRSGETYQHAMESLLGQFLHRFNKKILGTHRYIRCKESLRWIRVYENQGKRHSGIPVNHVHLLLEIPSSYERRKFEDQFRRLFSLLVYPLSAASPDSAVLNILHVRRDGIMPHSEYIQKQLVSWDAASERVSFSEIPACRGSNQATCQRPIWHPPLDVLAPCNS